MSDLKNTANLHHLTGEEPFDLILTAAHKLAKGEGFPERRIYVDALLDVAAGMIYEARRKKSLPIGNFSCVTQMAKLFAHNLVNKGAVKQLLHSIVNDSVLFD